MALRGDWIMPRPAGLPCFWPDEQISAARRIANEEGAAQANG